MPKLGTSGSVRGARGNSRPYRDHLLIAYSARSAPKNYQVATNRFRPSAPPLLQWPTSESGAGQGMRQRQCGMDGGSMMEEGSTMEKGSRPASSRDRNLCPKPSC